MSVDVGTAKGYLDLDISGFLKGLKSAQEEADKTTKSITNKVGSDFSKMGKSITSAGTTLTKNVTVPIVGAGAAVVKLSSNFETAMSKVSAISGATGEDLQSLNKKAQEMGAKTKFSATEAAEAFTYMAMAGWKTESMLEGIDGIMNLAAADGLDLATTSDIVTDALTAFGLEAKDSAHFADVLAKASSSANTNVSMLGESFKYVAPVAGSLGYTAEDTAIALGLMANAGIKGSQSGTALRGALTRMIKPAEQAANYMEKYGISITNANGTIKPLSEVMEMLREKMGGLTEAEQAQAAAAIFGQEAMSGMLSIINASDKDFDNLTEQIYNADGAAQKMASTMLDNLGGQVTILKSSLEGLALQFGEIVLPYIKQFVTWIQNLTQKLQQLTPEQKEQVAKWAAIIAAMGPLLLLFGKLITLVGSTITAFSNLPKVIDTVKTQFGLVKTAITGISAPVVAVVAVIALLSAAFISLWKTNEDFRNNVTAIWNEVKATFEGFTQGIVDRLNALGFNFQSITEVIKIVWKGFCDFLAPVFEGAFQLIADVFKFMTDLLLSVLDFWISVFTGDWKGAWDAIKNYFKAVWDLIVNIFKNVLNTMKGLLDTVCKWFGTTWSNVWDNIKTFFSNTWNSIKSTLSNALSNVKSTISNGLTSAKNTVFSIFDGIKTKISNTMDNAKTTVKNGIDKLKSFFNFKWSLPKIPLPHFSISGSFSLNPPSIPHFSVDWYKKAMSGGMILNSATIFGYDPTSGQFLGGGEAGSETIVGTGSLMKMIRQAVNDAIKPMVAATYQLARASVELGYITHNGFVKQQQMFNDRDRKNPVNSSGDTFNFYSPKAIDEIEAAKQLKKVKRELAEGF